MPKQVRVFYAYPNHPPDVGETITSTIAKLKAHSHLKQKNIRIRPWTDNAVSGKRLISAITGQLDRNQVFACDLTYPNANVNFELGYAIARFKRIFSSLNPSISEAARNYKRVYSSLLNLGYSQYANHEDLVEALLEERPWESLQQTLLENRHREQVPRPEKPTLMYIKPPLTSDSVIAAQEEFKKTIFADSIIVDDPNEYSSQIIEWYAEKLRAVDFVVVNLLSTEHSHNVQHNLKASIIAGLAYGFDRPMIMLAHAPYTPPVDYEQLLVVHDTADACAAATSKRLDDAGANLSHRRARRRTVVSRASRKMDLRSLFLGDPVAEHEADRLYEYFVETSTFYQALDDPLTILVGRRGSGKTAILYAIYSEMSNSTRNHVTILKPVGYETHGLIRVLEEIQQHSERGFLIESLWKYLIYSEIASTVASEIRERPVYQQVSSDEQAFLDYYEYNSRILTQPFSERIETAISSLEGVGAVSNATEQRLKISEHLHSSLIGELRRHLGSVLADYNSLALLIDGLDDPWNPGEHIDHLAELIAGLLGVAQYIPNDFRRSSSKIKAVNAKITVLLRSDIFAFIQHSIPEQDKLPIVRVKWNDRDLLLRVLEERMLHGAPRQREAKELWDELFPDKVVGVTSTEFLLRTVLPRPRDLIHFAKVAVNNAVNRGQHKISPEDLLGARDQYSQYAFQSILKEDDPSKGKLEAVLYEFAGADAIQEREHIESRFAAAGVVGQDVDFYLDLLCDISFLGIETTTLFRYSGDEEERRTLRNIARVLASRQDRSERFAINPAFHQVLQIE